MSNTLLANDCSMPHIYPTWVLDDYELQDTQMQILPGAEGR